jgi:long-chain acyl-CoA synthetase
MQIVQSSDHSPTGPGPEATSNWDLPWLSSYAPGIPFSISYPDVPVFWLLEEAARRWGGRTGAICFESRLTFSELLTKSYQFAHAMQELGVKRGTRVGILLPNVPEYITAINGLWMLGATAVQLSPLLVEDEIGKLLDITDCHTVVTLDMLTPPLRNLLGSGRLKHLIVASLEQRLGMVERWLYPIALLRRGVPWRNQKNGAIDFDALIASQPTHPLHTRIVPDRDAAIIQPTGGTTGSPKSVVLTHRNLLANALQLKAWNRGNEGIDLGIAVVPFFHCYGLTVVMLASMACAATMVMCPKFKAATVVKLIQRYRPTLMASVPALMVALNQYMKKHPFDLSSTNYWFSAASALPASVREEFESHGARGVVEAYGLSEASPATHANPIQQGSRPGTIGLPLPDTIARIVDLETGKRTMGPGEPGELIVRGPQVMSGYLDDSAATAKAIRDGWLFTGDIATYDADGFFKIVDRKKDLIKTSGYNVFPIEIEECVRGLAGVSDVAVIGVPDDEKGELVKAYVIPQPDSGLTVAAVEQYCREHLAKHKQPRQIELCAELPRNFLGKVLRRQLRSDEQPTEPAH